MNESSIFAMSVFFRPFVLLILAIAVFYPVKLAVNKWMKDGRLKRLLLREIN